MAEAIRRFEGAGPETDVFFLGAAFNAFQARVQEKRLVTFAAGEDAHITLAGTGGRWTSPVTGAFGGVAAREAQPAAVIFALAEAMTTWLKGEADAHVASIRVAPESFPDPNRAALENALFRAGWRVSESEINYHLPVLAPEALVRRLRESKPRALRKLKATGAVVRERSVDDAEAVYAAVAENHAKRGFPMGMTWPQLRAVGEAFPNEVRFVAVERAGEVLAGVFLLRVGPAYDYVFNWGERPDFRRESPLTLLTEGLMAMAHARGAAILDVGVATDRSAPNLGLIRFKEQLGCAVTAKRTWTLDLAASAGGGGAR